MTAPTPQQRPPTVATTPVTALRVLIEWSYADDAPLDFGALTSPATNGVRGRG